MKITKEDQYWVNIYNNSEEVLRCLLLILMSKGIVTDEEMEKYVLRFRHIKDQLEAEYDGKKKS